jgi:hypothetical protein
LTLLSTLIFINYAHAQKAQEIFPILKWLVNTTPYNWYSYLVDLVNSYSVATNLQINQPIKNGDDINLKFRAPSYVTPPNKRVVLRGRVVLREGVREQYIKDITDTEINSGNIKFTVPVLQFPTSTKVSFVYFGIYEEDSELSLLTPEKEGSILVVSPPLKYTYVPPPPPKITILTMPRVMAILEIKPETATEIKFQFKLENFSNANPFYLESITFQLNRQKKWPFKEVQVEVIQPHVSDRLGAGWTSGAELSPTMKLTFPTNPDVPLANGTYTVILRGFSYSLDDPNYPWEDGLVSFSLTSVTAKNPQGQVVRSTGQDTSETYKIYVPPPPKISIVPLARPETQKIMDLRPETTIEIPYEFEVKDVSGYQTLYLDSLVFRTNNWSWLPFKEIKVTVQAPDGNTVEATATNTRTYMAVFSFKDQQLSLVNGTYKVTFTGTTYSPQDQDYPWRGGRMAFRFHSVTASDQTGAVKVESSGSDISHTYQIIVPYYPSVNVNALVGSEEYPALVYEKEGDTATLYFTSFTGRFNAIRAGIQLPATSTLPWRGVTQSLEVSQDCGSTCPRTYEGLVAKFGSPDQWAIPLIRWDWSKTAQYTLNLFMNCQGSVPTIKNDDPNRNKSFVFVCSNRQAFGNNFGWNRKLNVRLSWSLTGNEKLNYEVFYPDVVKVSLSGTLQRALTATVFRGRR